MPPPVVGSFAQRVLNAVSPINYEDDKHNYALATFVGSLGDPLFQDIEDLVSDDAEGRVGWSPIVDVDRCPDFALPWLAQLVGVELAGGLSAANQRQQIRDLANWKRGTPGAIEGALLPYLTGTKSVVFRERDAAACPTDPPYGLTVITLASETPNPTAALAAMMRQKPAGIILLHFVVGAQSYANIFVLYPTYLAVYNHYPTYLDLLNDTTGSGGLPRLITPAFINATATISGKVIAKHRIGGGISATSTFSGAVTKPGAGAKYGTAFYGVSTYG